MGREQGTLPTGPCMPGIQKMANCMGFLPEVFGPWSDALYYRLLDEHRAAHYSLNQVLLLRQHQVWLKGSHITAWVAGKYYNLAWVWEGSHSAAWVSHKHYSLMRSPPHFFDCDRQYSLPKVILLILRQTRISYMKIHWSLSSLKFNNKVCQPTEN